jgi:glycosyltransferase involved in cell wall biosynthesis
MKVACITSQFPFGPSEAFLSAELATLAQYAQDIVIIPTRPRTKAQVQETFGLSVLRLPPFSGRVFALASAEFMAHPGRVARLLTLLLVRKYRFSSKLKNLALFPKALAVARMLRRSGVGHIHAHWLSTPSTVAFIASELTGIPWSCTAHRFDIFEDNLLKTKANSARFIRAISERNRRIIVEKTGGVLNGRCGVLHMGVMLPPHASTPNNAGPLRILSAAAFVPVKGHRYLLAALSLLKNRDIPFECDLAGDGPLRPAIEALVRELRLERNVRFRGNVEHDRLCADLLNGRYDVTVLASTEEGPLFEGVPVALMESMAAGVCCLATRTGSIPELINDDRCSRLVPQRDPLALADALTGLYLDTHARAALASEARRRIEEAFDARQTGKQLYELMCAR